MNTEVNKWLRLDDEPCENGFIETLHEDGTLDVARIVNGEIYLYDMKTDSPIAVYRSAPYFLQLKT